MDDEEGLSIETKKLLLKVFLTSLVVILVLAILVPLTIVLNWFNYLVFAFIGFTLGFTVAAAAMLLPRDKLVTQLALPLAVVVLLGLAVYSSTIAIKGSSVFGTFNIAYSVLFTYAILTAVSTFLIAVINRPEAQEESDKKEKDEAIRELFLEEEEKEQPEKEEAVDEEESKEEESKEEEKEEASSEGAVV